MQNGKSIQIVPYDPKYREQVLELAHEMHAESVTQCNFPLDEEKLLQQLAMSQTMPDTVYVRLAILGADVLGGFFGVISTTFFSPKPACKDMVWFVRKNRRGGLAALRLVADFEQWGLDHGVRDFYLGQSTGVAIETTMKLYEHLGYEVVGVNTYKRVRMINEGKETELCAPAPNPQPREQQKEQRPPQQRPPQQAPLVPLEQEDSQQEQLVA